MTNLPTLTIESILESMRMLPPALPRQTLLIPSRMELPVKVESGLLLSGIPVVRSEYLPIYEPREMPTREGRTRRGYKIARKFAINRSRRHAKELGATAYLLSEKMADWAECYTEQLFADMFKSI